MLPIQQQIVSIIPIGKRRGLSEELRKPRSHKWDVTRHIAKENKRKSAMCNFFVGDAIVKILLLEPVPSWPVNGYPSVT